MYVVVNESHDRFGVMKFESLPEALVCLAEEARQYGSKAFLAILLPTTITVGATVVALG